MKNYIVYQGSKFTIEWYLDDQGKSQAREYFLELPDNRKDKALHLFKVMGEFGKIMNEEKFRTEDDQIFAFKPLSDRFLCFFFVGSKIIVTNAFEKKTNKLPPREKERALKYRKDYLERVKRGNYYD